MVTIYCVSYGWRETREQILFGPVLALQPAVNRYLLIVDRRKHIIEMMNFKGSISYKWTATNMAETWL